ncbi:helix-turn-helix domain-containing protein [Chryseobacterium sp. VD8]|uniref:helix-turn-helix domain-containing protein n=1 Tax=Chryseobacterium sp. VD8 TaxID=3081254 RepID=UPI003018D074
MIVFVFKNTFTIPQTKGNSHFNSSKIIISYALIFGFIFYYNSILIKSKYTHIIQKEENDFEDSLLSDEENLEGGFDEKKIIFYNELYQQIENYFKINTPWKDSNFNIQVLAHNIQSNTTYISRAINLNAGMNFKNFVNVYRVEFIKTEIQNNKNYRRYKLLYLYSKAGFKHQSTFNKAFKRITNMTPSDYIEFINKENTLNKD